MEIAQTLSSCRPGVSNRADKIPLGGVNGAFFKY